MHPSQDLTRRSIPFERSIDIETYDRHAEKLREELTLARIDRHSGQLDELDVEGILAFAERVLPRAADLWVQASLEQRQRFQQLFFPDGIPFNGNGFVGTRVSNEAMRTSRREGRLGERNGRPARWISRTDPSWNWRPSHSWPPAASIDVTGCHESWIKERESF